MNLLIQKLYKEIAQQQKYLRWEDLRNAKKSNQLILRLVTLIEEEIKTDKVNVSINVKKKEKKSK
tara:strand:+ start:334 stop:528 length:195 start_codon:yes stop_codon:yes gene_type:complete